MNQSTNPNPNPNPNPNNQTNNHLNNLNNLNNDLNELNELNNVTSNYYNTNQIQHLHSLSTNLLNNNNSNSQYQNLSSQSSSQITPSSDQYYASRSASDSSGLPSRRSNNQPVGFRRLLPGTSELFPIIHDPPSEPRLNPYDGSYISPLKALTIHLADTYRLLNPSFRYELSLNPRRVLTKPSKPAGNNGLDNEDSDYILYVNDILGGSPSSNHPIPEPQHRPKSFSSSGTPHKYLILDLLGQGTFGQVVKCQDIKTHQVVAVKVIKNKQAYFSQSMMEVTILELLNNTWDPENRHHILRMKDTFIHHNHLCIVFELLSSNLYELIKQNSFRGLSTSLVRVFTNQLLDALTVLNEAHLIHCDLKPENILLTSLSSPEIKVIDFGSACHERQTVYTYIQSRFYRSPEVILGLPYSSGIDMWSLGCICVELFLGLPLFPGTSEYNQITRIVEMLGMPPTYMLEVGRQTQQFFDVMEDNLNGGRKVYKLKSLEQYSKEHNVAEQPSKRYFQQNTLEDIISQYPVIRKGMKPADLEKEKQNRIAFIDFVKGLLTINPMERWSPQQARLHPFILGEPLREPYVPMKLNPVSGSSSGADRIADLNQKRYSSTSHPPTNSQTSPQIAGGTSSNEAKRPYGGLPAAPVRSGQKLYDAAAYSQLQAQQQVANAQAAAIRQHQAQAAQQSQNPYALPSESRSNLSQLPSQSNTQQQQTQNSSNVALQMQSQYPSNRVTLAHASQPASLANVSSAAINIPHSYYPMRGPACTISGSFNTSSLPGPQMSGLMSQHQMIYNPILNPSGSSHQSSNPGMTSGGRQRSGTLDQMDMVPPQLQKVQVDLTNYAGQSVTPVLRRDDQYLAWERRQQQGGSTTGITGNSGLSRRPSYRSNPQLDYLHEQAESNDSWSSAHQGQARYTHYQPMVNSSARYMTTGAVPVPLPLASSSQQQARNHSQNVVPNLKNNHASFSVVVDDEFSGATGRSENNGGGGGPSESTRTTTLHEIVPLDEYDHRDGGQAMAYLPIIPKPSSANNCNIPSGDSLLNTNAAGPARVEQRSHHHPQHHVSSFGKLMNL